MQNKQIIIGVVATAIILLGAGGVFVFNMNKNNQPNNTTTATEAKKTGNSILQGSIQDIFSIGKTAKCIFSVNNDSTSTQGTIYVDRDNASSEFIMTTNGKESKMYMIRNGDTFYTWGDSLPAGIKITMSVDEMASKMQSGGTSKSFDPNQKVDYKCDSWRVDSSKFIPPSNVKFTDLGSLTIPSSAKTSGTPSKANCSICNSLTGDTKAACLSSLNCQ